MLTLVEAISLAGDRAKQNDDAHGYANGAAWVIDGATDLHAHSISGAASDAAWIAHAANAYFHTHAGASDQAGMRALLRHASADAAKQFAALGSVPDGERWKSPICSLLMAVETPDGVSIIEAGDCRVFALDAADALYVHGGPPEATDQESSAARAMMQEAAKPLLDRTNTMAMLRESRACQNGSGGSWTFGLNPECADHARVFALPLRRPAHILLCTDGLSALVDRYDAYDAAGLVRAALDKGLQELGRELRQIEAADATGAQHPRFKRSDDATGLLIRLA